MNNTVAPPETKGNVPDMATPPEIKDNVPDELKEFEKAVGDNLNMSYLSKAYLSTIEEIKKGE